MRGRRVPIHDLLGLVHRPHDAVVEDHPVVQPFGQIFASEVLPNRARGPRTERAPVRGVRIEQLGQPGGQVGVGLGDPVVAEHPTVDMAIDPFDSDGDVHDAWDGHRASSSACTSLP